MLRPMGAREVFCTLVSPMHPFRSCCASTRVYRSQALAKSPPCQAGLQMVAQLCLTIGGGVLCYCRRCHKDCAEGHWRPHTCGDLPHKRRRHPLQHRARLRRAASAAPRDHEGVWARRSRRGAGLACPHSPAPLAWPCLASCECPECFARLLRCSYSHGSVLRSPPALPALPACLLYLTRSTRFVCPGRSLFSSLLILLTFPPLEGQKIVCCSRVP